MYHAHKQLKMKDNYIANGYKSNIANDYDHIIREINEYMKVYRCRGRGSYILQQFKLSLASENADHLVATSYNSPVKLWFSIKLTATEFFFNVI